VVAGAGVKDSSPIKDTAHVFGFVWKNSPEGVERINGDKNYDRITNPANIPSTMAAYAALGAGTPPQVPSYFESYGYPSSAHPNGVNVAFCGGQVEFMAESVEPRILAQLMTSNRNRSTLVINGAPERRAPEPSDSDY
jgi:prepilin-type processing-associated H-X9-DG protein